MDASVLASALSIPLAWSVNNNFKSVFDIVFLIGYCRRSIYTFVIFPVCSHSLMGFLCNNVVLLQDLLWKKAYSSCVWPWFAEAYSDKGCQQLYWQICKCICSHFVTSFVKILNTSMWVCNIYLYTYVLWCSNSLQQLMNTFFIVFVWIQLGGLSIEYQIDGKTYPVLAFAKGDAWKRRRRLISPAFTASKLRLVSVCVHACMRVCMHRHLCMREA